MAATRRSTAISTVITVMAMLAMTGCQDQTPTDPTVTGIALKPGGGGGKGPKVESTDPTSAPQETTLNVQVFGSSFDDGSEVTFTIDGTPSDLVRTDTTKFVSDKELIASITIDLNAITDLYDVEVLSSRGRKGIGADLFSVTKKGKPVEESNYTITDLGTEGFVKDINDAGLIVGGASGRAAQWINTGGGYSMEPEPLDDGVWESGPGSWAEGVNASGDVVGVLWIDYAVFTNRAALWSGGTVRLLDLLDQTHEESQAYGINDAGQISGQSYTSSYDPARAVRWEPDGSATELGVLPGYQNSIGWAINNLGWVAGSSRPANSEWPAKKQHAVLWIDDGSGQISALLDLHPVPEIMSIVKGISDVSTDGKVYLAGTVDSRPVVWVVDVATVVWDGGDVTSVVIDERVLEEVSGAQAVNAAGEVVVHVGGVGGGAAVWTLATGLLEPLPGLSSKQRCSSSGRGINNVGMVVGWSEVFAKGQCVRHPVVWTKMIN